MRIVVNEAKVKRESNIGKFAIYGSLAILMGGLALTLFGQQWGILTPDNIALFYIIYLAILFSGLVVSRVGMYYGNRHLSPRRPELALREQLKGMDRKCSLLLFTEPCDYILIEPSGVTAIIYKTQNGLITYKGNLWKFKTTVVNRLFGREEPLGDPKKEIDLALTRLNAVFTEKIPDQKIPLRGVVVFGGAEAVLEVDPTPYAVLRVDKLKDYLRGEGKLREVPAATQKAVREALGVMG